MAERLHIGRGPGRAPGSPCSWRTPTRLSLAGVGGRRGRPARGYAVDRATWTVVASAAYARDGRGGRVRRDHRVRPRPDRAHAGCQIDSSGSDHRVLLPASALGGATTLMLADAAARDALTRRRSCRSAYVTARSSAGRSSWCFLMGAVEDGVGAALAGQTGVLRLPPELRCSTGSNLDDPYARHDHPGPRAEAAPGGKGDARSSSGLDGAAPYGAWARHAVRRATSGRCGHAARSRSVTRGKSSPQGQYPVFDFTVEETVRMGRAPHLGLSRDRAAVGPPGSRARRWTAARSPSLASRSLPRCLGRRAPARDARAQALAQEAQLLAPRRADGVPRPEAPRLAIYAAASRSSIGSTA